MDKDPKSIARSAISSAKTRAIITAGRKEGKSEKDIAYEALGGEKGLQETAFNMRFVITMRSMCAALGIDPKDIYNSDAFAGYAAILQHYPDHPAAIEFDKLYRDDVTVEEVWKYVLSRLGKNSSVLYTSGNYDAEWFSKLLAIKMVDFDMRFGFSKKHAEAIRAQLYLNEGDDQEEST